MSHKRILILANRVPYPLKDGGNLAMSAMIHGYQQDGWRVYLLAMNTTRHPVGDEELTTIYRNLEGFTAISLNNDLKVTELLKNLLFSRQPNHAQRFFNKEFLQKSTEIILQFNPHVIQIESIFLATYMPHIRQFSDAVTILRLHNIEYQVWERLANDTGGIFKKIFLNNLVRRMKRFEELSWRQFDLLLPIAETDARVVADAGVTTAMVVAPFGIDPGKIQPSRPLGEWKAYHLGAMDWMPNTDAINWFLEDVWPAIHRQLPEFEFYFAGRGMPEAFKKIRVQGVFCMGEVSDAQDFIADKKILIVPLRSGGGIRVKILEAMAAGKIVISTDVGMQGIDARHGVHYIVANERDEFVTAVQWCLSNRGEGEQIAVNAMILVREKYDQRIIMQNISSAINKKLAQRS